MELLVAALNLSAAAAATADNVTSLLVADSHTPADSDLIDSYQRNRSVQNPAHSVLIVMYGCLIVLGSMGNTLVVLAVVRKPSMRTARNMFIVNLAVSDLVLCIVTMPLTLMEILAKYWPLGNDECLCKTIGTLQATSIFVSTISITSIAMDRYQVIVYPTRDNLQCMGAALILAGIWLAALVLASPMVIYKRLRQHQVNLTVYGINEVYYCVEDWPMEHGRAIYSGISLGLQYVLPILIVSAAYFGIYGKLRSRFQSAGTAVAVTADRRQHRSDRMRHTNCLLLSIALIFGISWLPLNLYNLVTDIWLSSSANTQPMLIAYAVCHMMGMSSACSNPFMYGWLNDNFRKEFREILCMRPQSICVVTTNQSQAAERQTGRMMLVVTGGNGVAEAKGCNGSGGKVKAVAAEEAVLHLQAEPSKSGSECGDDGGGVANELMVLV